MLQYHLSSRQAKLGKNQGKTVYYAQAITRGTLPFEAFCREVAEGSTVDVADVKAVLSRLHTVIIRNISRGFSVEVGELGNFRPTFGSAEVLDPKTFDVLQHVRNPKITFRPRVGFIQGFRTLASFERVARPEAQGKGKKGKGKHSGSPAGSPKEKNPKTPGGSEDNHLGI